MACRGGVGLTTLGVLHATPLFETPWLTTPLVRPHAGTPQADRFAKEGKILHTTGEGGGDKVKLQDHDAIQYEDSKGSI